MPSTRTLTGDVATVFTFGKEEDFADTVEQVRAEQELVCGYPLQVKSTRQTHYQDHLGRDIYEVYATFEPVPPVEAAEDGG